MILTSLGLLAVAPAARAQGVSTTDAREATRFAAVVRAASRAGYANAVVVGHGESAATDSIFALTATRADSGVLILVLQQQSAGAAARPAELERASTPADLGLRGITFASFLGANGIVDVVVNHVPFQLESSRSFETHHLVRRAASGLDAACEFPGQSTSSASKGIGSIQGASRVTITRTGQGLPIEFMVRQVDQTTEQSRGAAPVTSVQSDSTRRYQLPSSGKCRRV
ncbi:MAG TPA: hypothetical protein VGI92_07420 [Gemmatimonadales bacterium]